MNTDVGCRGTPAGADGHPEMGGEEAARHPRDVIEDIITLLGNAVGQTSKNRCKRVLKAYMQELADDEELFAEAAPNLFGPKFETKMKERAESVKLLRRSLVPQRFFPEGAAPSVPREAAAHLPIKEAESLSRTVHSNPEGTFYRENPREPTELRTETPMHTQVMPKMNLRNILLTNLGDPNQHQKCKSN